jgi:hypothetical protein
MELPGFGLAYAEAGAAVYATSSIFVRIMKYAGKFLRKLLTGD